MVSQMYVWMDRRMKWIILVRDTVFFWKSDGWDG